MNNDKITKLELIEILSDKTGITKKKIDKMFEALKDVIKESAIENKKILIRNFLKIESYDTKERKIKFPNSKRAVKVKPRRKVKIHLANTFIKEINEELNKKSKSKK